MRAVPADLSPEVVAGIDRQLADLERTEGVRLLWAIESGSRAWGFPSPDSDYDCRFLYLRSAADYLGPWQPRDVLELPPDPVFDVNGWDLVKAVRLLVKGNATVGEWLRSPIVYRGDETFRNALLALADEVFRLDRARAHYLHIGRLQWPADPTDGRLKRRMYALRAAASLRWLREHDPAVPPMSLPTLVAETDLPPAVADQVQELIERKSRTREAEPGSVPEEITRFVLEEFALAEELLAASTVPIDEAPARRAATAFFQEQVARF